jgi:hypothetical protein
MKPSPWVLVGLVLVVVGASLLFSRSAYYRKLRKTLERPWRVERFIYRHHRLSGGTIVVGSLIFLTLLGRYHGIRFETLSWPSSGGAQLLLLARLSAWLFATLTLVVGLVVAIRPSLLKGVEAKANRWIQPAPPGSPPTGQLGALLLVAGLVVLLLAISL